MPLGARFTLVEAIARTLPDVEVTTTWGQPTLKVRGKMFVCSASHKSAEPDTLVVMMDFADRDARIEEDPTPISTQSSVGEGACRGGRGAKPLGER
jgi:hypothetical protein